MASFDDTAFSTTAFSDQAFDFPAAESTDPTAAGVSPTRRSLFRGRTSRASNGA